MNGTALKGQAQQTREAAKSGIGASGIWTPVSQCTPRIIVSALQFV